MGKATKNTDIEKYIVRPVRQRKILDVRDYIIPTGRKRKTRWSEQIDKILYGAK